MREVKSIASYALKIAIPYLAVSAVWILGSDYFLGHAVSDSEALTDIQTYKGLFFVTMSALFVYLIARRYLHELKQAMTSLEESRRAMSTLQGNLPGMAYRCRNDHSWTMLAISDGCLELTGYPAADLIGDAVVSYGQLIVPGDREMVHETIQRAVTAQQPYLIEYRITAGGGTEKWVWEQGCGVFDTDGDLVALEGYIFDITEKRRLEEQLRVSDRLNHIGEAASTIIHDLKNQMHVIIGHVELLRETAQGADEARYLDTIDNQVEAMLSMSQELLDYAKGEFSLAVGQVNVTELLEQLISTYQLTFGQAGVDMSHTSRREPDSSPVFELDQGKVWRALLNLVTNAKEAMPSGGQIWLRSLIGPEDVRIEVQDSGPGMPEEIRDRLFEPFVTYGKAGGTGLGLAIVKKIVAAHQGRISFTTNMGSGTTFTITFPRKTALSAPAPKANAAAQSK